MFIFDLWFLPYSVLELSVGYNKSEKNRPGVESYLQLKLICFSETIHDFMKEPIRADLATELLKNLYLFKFFTNSSSRDYWFRTYKEFSKKLTFLTPDKQTHTCAYQAVKNASIS